MNTSRLRFPALDGLLAFEAAARYGTFERAAEELCVTGSAVAKRVAAVEQLLGVPLLNRCGKTLALTDAGKAYLQQVVGPLRLLAAVPLHRLDSASKRRLRVCAPPTFARQMIAPCLQEFSDRHTSLELELELVLSTPYADRPPGATDLWIRGGEPVEPGCTILSRDCVTPLIAPSLVRRIGLLREPADLAAAPLLRTPLEPWTPWLRAAGLDWAEPDQGPRLMDLGLLLEAAASGQGIAPGRPTLARQWLATGALVPLFPEILCPVAPYYLMPHSWDGPAGEFAEWLVGICARAGHEASEYLSRVPGINFGQ
jgi:LysR family transcriptional regulator, glycine cleavage system transcriptional activator